MLRSSEEHTCSCVQTDARVACTRGCSTRAKFLFSSFEE